MIAMRPRSRRIRKHDRCMRCGDIPCINFYRWTRKGAGGEVNVFKKMIEKGEHVPCEIGQLIYFLCIFLQRFEDRLLSSSLFVQCIRDLKACVFLLLFGHYRGSIQLLRPVMENMLTAIYFDNKLLRAKDEEERVRILEDYERFCNGKYEIPEQEWRAIYPQEKKRRKLLEQDFLLGWLMHTKKINGRDKARMQRKVGLLNKYLHPHPEYTEISKSHSPNCPALVAYNENEYEQCALILQDVIADFLWLFRDHVEASYPRRWQYKRTQTALENLKSMEIYEKEIGKKIIFSTHLRNFIISLPLANER